MRRHLASTIALASVLVVLPAAPTIAAELNPCPDGWLAMESIAGPSEFDANGDNVFCGVREQQGNGVILTLYADNSFADTSLYESCKGEADWTAQAVSPLTARYDRDADGVVCAHGWQKPSGEQMLVVKDD